MKKHKYMYSLKWQLRSVVRPCRILAFLLLAGMLMVHATADAAPQITVKGMVTDENGNALSGVTVGLKNSSTGTITDAEGAYSITLPDGNGTLVFTSVGFVKKEVPVKGRARINVILTRSVASLNKIVVIGYGTQKKSDLTGAISSLDESDFNKGVASSPDQLLQGKAAGVRVVKNSSEPGGGVSISIRGASSINAGTGPLYVIDGLPVDNTNAVGAGGQNYVNTRSPRNPLSAINPADIASIEVLKDASATAIYGARGANGVILITTKRGKAGKLKVSYNVYTGVQNVSNRLDVLNAQQYMTVLNDIIAAGGGTPGEKVTGITDGGTDWQEALFRKNAMVQSHNLSFAGGNSQSRYFASLNYFDQQGVVVSSGFKRYSARFNLDSKISDKFNIGLSLNASYSHNDYVPVGFGFNELSGALYAAYNFDPTLPIKNPDGSYALSPFITIDNPLALAYGKNALSDGYRTYGTIFGNYEILPGLTAKVNIGGDILSERRDVYVNRTTNDGTAANGVATILNGLQSNYLFEGTLTYDKTFNDIHHITVLGGATTQRFVTNNNSSNIKGFPSDATGSYNIDAGTQSTANVASDKLSHRLLSYIGRVNYSLADKYLLTATFRADGSSRFGANNKFGYFPSIAGAWRISQEDFMKQWQALSNLKLRVSWGQTGNQAIGDYRSIVTYTSGPDAAFNEEQVSTQDPARLPNPDLKWETTRQFDAGIDIGFFNNRVSATVDYYRKHTFDMLIDLPVPTSTGFNSRLSNVGSIKNTGWEVTVNSLNLDGQFKWNTSINLSTLKNTVEDIGGLPPIITGSAGTTPQIAIMQVGQPLRSFYGYQILGIWQKDDDFTKTKDNVQPGDLKFRDVNGDGTVNGEDRVILGNSFPKLTWSFGNTFSYKRLSLDVFFQGVQGIKMINNNLVDSYFPVNFRRNKFAEPYLNRWTPEHPSNRYPSFVTPLDQGQKLINSYTVEDASYLRLETVTLRYSFPRIGKVFQSASLYITGQNLFTLTDYDGVDPAVNPNGDANFRIDFNAYPPATTFLIGANLNF